MMKQSALVEINCNSPGRMSSIICQVSFHKDTHTQQFQLGGYLSATCDMLYHLSNYTVMYLSLKLASIITLYGIKTCLHLYPNHKHIWNKAHIFFPLKAR